MGAHSITDVTALRRGGYTELSRLHRAPGTTYTSACSGRNLAKTGGTHLGGTLNIAYFSVAVFTSITKCSRPSPADLVAVLITVESFSNVSMFANKFATKVK